MQVVREADLVVTVEAKAVAMEAEATAVPVELGTNRQK